MISNEEDLMSQSGYAYMLRYTIQPGHHEEERLQSLAAFCRNAGIGDVMFLINGEELNQGHLTLEETKPWMALISRGKQLLEPLGVTTSINPWPTLHHGDRGRGLKATQNFRLMTDPFGNRSQIAVCPLCPEWRRYITDIYAYYATLRPFSLWVEDDFRFHNHEPLTWGGCFCDEHLRQFAARAGIASLDRATFVRELLAPGAPHPFRSVWLDSCRETLVDLAREIGEAVHRVSPETRIGLMTSCPDVHAAEGRDWHGLLAAFDGSQAPIVRPHLPAYSENTGFKYMWRFHAFSRTTVALLPESAETYPELENFPYSLFAKSTAFQKFQMETALLLGSRGITMNIFDMMGNGVYPEEHESHWLMEEKPFLDAVVSLGLRCRDEKGVQVLIQEKSSYTLHTARGESMEELYPRETLWASLLSAFGIANRFVTGQPCERSVVALSGQTLRNMSDTAIRDLFASHFILLEGEAAHTLFRMGLGHLSGIEHAAWYRHENGYSAYEQIVDGHRDFGIAEGRMSSQLYPGNLMRIRYNDSVQPISEIRNPEGERICTGMALANGRVFILPYGAFRAGDGEFLTNPLRRSVLQRVLKLMTPTNEAPVFISSYHPHVSLHRFESSESGQTLAIVNASLDDVNSLAFSGWDFPMDRWLAYYRHYPQGQQAALRRHEGSVVLEAEIPALSMLILNRKG